jgi:hypothetical protein
MINKVATTHCSFLRLQIKRENISTNAVSVTKTELYTILWDVCIVSNRLTCIDSKLSEMEILAQPLSLPFIIENLNYARLFLLRPVLCPGCYGHVYVFRILGVIMQLY